MVEKYIDAVKHRDELINVVYDVLSDDNDNDNANLIIDTFDDLPAADVREVRHGKWKEMYSVKCSVCGNSHAYETTYCPSCGGENGR